MQCIFSSQDVPTDGGPLPQTAGGRGRNGIRCDGARGQADEQTRVLGQAIGLLRRHRSSRSRRCALLGVCFPWGSNGFSGLHLHMLLWTMFGAAPYLILASRHAFFKTNCNHCGKIKIRRKTTSGSLLPVRRRPHHGVEPRRRQKEGDRGPPQRHCTSTGGGGEDGDRGLVQGREQVQETGRPQRPAEHVSRGPSLLLQRHGNHAAAPPHVRDLFQVFCSKTSLK